VLTAAVLNQKGGVGKTSVSLLLAGAAGALGLRVLVIDLDQQGNASSALGVSGDAAELTSYEVLDQAQPGAAAAAAVPAPGWPGVSVIPAHRSLASLNMSAELGIESRLRTSLQGIDSWDLVLIDCPPAVDRMVQNALTAADVALIVTQPTRFSLEGVGQVMDTIDKVQRYLNPALTVAGAVINGLRPRTREGALRVDELRASLETAVWEPPIPERQVVREMEGAGVPLTDFGRDALPVTRAVDVLLARLLWLDDAWRTAHPDRDPDRVHADYLAWVGTAPNDTAPNDTAPGDTAPSGARRNDKAVS
jgi:chromosome partitioning protein